MERDTASLKIERVEQRGWINERFDVKVLIRSSTRRTNKQKKLWNKVCVSRKPTTFLSLKVGDKPPLFETVIEIALDCLK